MPRDIGTLLRALKSDDWRARLEAAHALGDTGDAAAVEPLIECLKREVVTAGEAAATSHAVEALGKLGRGP